MQPLYSFVIPVYNRPQEVRELLESMLSLENAPEYEILIIEDGSSEKADLVCEQFSEKLKIRYFSKRILVPAIPGISGCARPQAIISSFWIPM